MDSCLRRNDGRGERGILAWAVVREFGGPTSRNDGAGMGEKNTWIPAWAVVRQFGMTGLDGGEKHMDSRMRENDG